MKNIAVFASGTGSNFLAIAKALEDENNCNVALLVSDKPQSLAVQKAHKLNIDVFCLNPKEYESKQRYEQEIITKLNEYNIDLIALAGYMRIIGPTILNSYERRIINIHPSLLPSFKGRDAIKQAIEMKVVITGVTIHYVDDGIDTGEIVAQKAIDISHYNSLETITKEIHKIEHELYPKTIIKLLEE